MTRPLTVRGDGDGRWLEITVHREGWAPAKIAIVASPKGRVWAIEIDSDVWVPVRFPSGAYARIGNTAKYGSHVALYDVDDRWVDGGYVDPEGKKPE